MNRVPTTMSGFMASLCCHSERSEESHLLRRNDIEREILRCAQNDSIESL